MIRKYTIDTEENRDFLRTNVESLLAFGRRFSSPGGSAYYLGDDGTPWKERNRETWITSRMAHVYSIGAMLYSGQNREPVSTMHQEQYGELADAALRGLSGELKDTKNGGWYAGRTKDDEIVPGKQCYAHAFVILAACSAVLAKRPGAKDLLQEALLVYDKWFWDEKEGLSCDNWNTEFTIQDSYRGLNANMHTVEAFLAVADVTGDELYRKRAGRIIDRVLLWAEENQYRIPEHFTQEWIPDLQMNREKSDDPFKPYGATPGHGIEWARLIIQWAVSTYGMDNKKTKPYIDAACRLYDRAVTDAWNVDGAPGIVYTTDWEGHPVVHDRMHWTLAEAINSSAILYRVTGNDKYSADYSKFMEYLDMVVIDYSCGSWFHQLDETNHLLNTVWPGKSDLYHAVQAMLIPYGRVDISIAKDVINGVK